MALFFSLTGKIQLSNGLKKKAAGKLNKIWIEADIKDFFVQGEPEDLVSDLFSGVSSSRARKALEDVAHLILTSQFLYDPIYKII